MCQTPLVIRSAVTGRLLEVDCGHCLECRINKSKKYFQLLKNYSQKKGLYRFFVNLSYMPACVPYVKVSDFADMYFDGTVPLIHRDEDYKRYYNRDLGKICVKTYYNQVYNDLPSTITKTDFDSVFDCPRLVISHKNGKIIKDENKIGVLLYSDIQRYIKRIRKQLPSDCKIDYYFVGEYGSEKQLFRPHWHGLVFCPIEYKDIVSTLLYTSWYYCVDSRKSVETALSPEHYLSLYVTKVDDYAKGLYLLSPRFVHYSRDLHRFFPVKDYKIKDFEFTQNDGSISVVPSYYWYYNFPFGYKKNSPKHKFSCLDAYMYRNNILVLSSLGRIFRYQLDDYVLTPSRIFGFDFPKVSFTNFNICRVVTDLSSLYDYSIFVDTLYRSWNSYLIKRSLLDNGVIPARHKLDYPLRYPSEQLPFIEKYFNELPPPDISKYFDFIFHQQLNQNFKTFEL